MVYRPHTLMSFGGQLTGAITSGSGDIWECNLRLVQLDEPTNPVTNPAAFMEGIAAHLATWFSSEAAGMSNGSNLGWLKVNGIGADGKYSDPSHTNVHDYTTPAVGADSGAASPICSLAYSWTTPIMRGPGKNGRIYPPNFTYGAAGHQVVSNANQLAALAGAQALYAVINIGDGGENAANLVVASKVNATNTVVTGIRIGNVYDVQRRRKNGLVEVYVSGGTS